MLNQIELVQGDITKQNVDAIVNAANSSLMGGGGVDGAIHRAGGPAILQACKQIVAECGRLPTGQAVITTGGNLAARYVIHTVGPVWYGGNQNEGDLLRDAYRNCLSLADQYHLKTLGFPSISTGAYGCPIEWAAQIALHTTLEYLPQSKIQKVCFVLFSLTDFQVYQTLLRRISKA